MSIVLFSKTFVEKINTIIVRFWWVGFRKINTPVLLPFAPRMTCVNPLLMEVWELEICISSIRVLLYTCCPIHVARSIATNKNPFLSACVYAGTVVSETSEKWCYHLSVIIKEVYTLQLNSQKYNRISSNLHFSRYFFVVFWIYFHAGKRPQWYSRIYFLKENGHKSWP
jgi:hypothetical protein